MIEVLCTGTPYEAREQVHGTLEFYRAYFQETARLDWGRVCEEATKWLPLLEAEFPQYVAEMQVDLPLTSVLALNVRTEIAFGQFSDGCTSVALHTDNAALLAQNWDWRVEQAPNLIKLTIKRTPTAETPEVPAPLSIITEAGIIGKIGLSAAGVGVVLNAIAAKGYSPDRLPVHLALRAALDWAGMPSCADGLCGGAGLARTVADRLKKVGVASAAHILIADGTEAIGLETSFRGVEEVRAARTGLKCGGHAVLHSNHYVETHAGVEALSMQIDDSPARLARATELITSAAAVASAGADAEAKRMLELLRDTDGFPNSICRDKSSNLSLETLFAIVMDLRNVRGTVVEGRPDKEGRTIMLDPQAA